MHSPAQGMRKPKIEGSTDRVLSCRVHPEHPATTQLGLSPRLWLVLQFPAAMKFGSKTQASCVGQDSMGILLLTKDLLQFSWLLLPLHFIRIRRPSGYNYYSCLQCSAALLSRIKLPSFHPEMGRWAVPSTKAVTFWSHPDFPTLPPSHWSVVSPLIPECLLKQRLMTLFIVEIHTEYYIWTIYLE